MGSSTVPGLGQPRGEAPTPGREGSRAVGPEAEPQPALALRLRVTSSAVLENDGPLHSCSALRTPHLERVVPPVSFGPTPTLIPAG